MLLFPHICFYTCQICFCTGVPFQTPFPFAVHSILQEQSVKLQLSFKVSFVSVTVVALTLTFKRASSRQLKRGWKVTVTTSNALSSLSHQTLLICGSRPLLELLLVLAGFVPLERSRVTPESPGKKKRKYSSPIRDLFFWRQPASIC